MLEEFYNDDIKAIDARFEAQKIAFAPIIFQVSKCMIDFNILKIIEEAGDAGITEEDILKKVNLSSYALSTLLELSLGLSLIKIVKDSNPYKYILGKTGFFLINDNLTRVNINFVNDICYKGMFYLNDSLKNSKPEGLKVFGDYETIYKGLSSIPESDRKSWIDFDNYYSDGCYESSLPIIFKKSRKNIMDIGANTAKFSISALKYNNDVRCSLVDLEGQIKLAKKNIDDSTESPKITFASPIVTRRFSQLTKMTCYMAHRLKLDTDMLFFTSARGEIDIQYKINTSFARENEVKPAMFTLSVFNTAPAEATILLKSKVPYCPIYSGFENAVRNLITVGCAPLISERLRSVMLIYAEEVI